VFVVGLEKTKTSEDIGILDIKDIKDIALIVGNEVDGISEDILRLCDNVVHIPMHGRKESLNVSIAAGIAMYEIKKLL